MYMYPWQMFAGYHPAGLRRWASVPGYPASTSPLLQQPMAVQEARSPRNRPR